MLAALRSDANWSGLKPARKGLRQRFLRRLAEHVERAEPGSLASLVASTPASARTFPVEQVPQWLFAFDAAGMASFRTLALLDAHPDVLARVHEEISSAGDGPELPLLRACVLESLRLWPTTPAVLRDSTERTHWQSGELPEGTALVIFAPFFHRDGERLPYADSFDPGLWRDGNTSVHGRLIPFSDGPGQCPGRNLVLLTTSLLLAELLRDGRWRSGALDAGRPLPGTLSPFRLRFEVAEMRRGARP
jgi:cytochrome P450